MIKFDANTVALQGFNLIEASAGTGKTYTLAELYLRLILEKELSVDQILVVTYTRAATEELRDSLRQKLVNARDQRLEQLEPELLELRRLNLAIQSFDEAAIFTIHSFCQRVLGDYAFESGFRFDLNLIVDDHELLQSAADDFWRKYISTADKSFISYLRSQNETVERLLKSISSFVGRPYLNILPAADVDVGHHQQHLQTQFEKLKSLWLTQQDEVVATLQDNSLLDGNKYRTASVAKWLRQLAELCEEDEFPTILFKDFNRFTPAKLEDALKKNQQLPELEFWVASELLLEQLTQLQQIRKVQWQSLRLQLLNYLREKLPQQKLQQGVQSYDDLLLNLEQALTGKRGDWLVKRLQNQYQAVFIDEFQDTDPIQYASFKRIFADSDLVTFLVGDPKQAIYSFRGADIFAYLKAKHHAQAEYTLSRNWRSHPLLVSAINTIFSRNQTPFIYEDIPFHAVDAQRPEQMALNIDQADNSPFKILWATSDKTLDKKGLTSIAANETANQIAQLLNLAQQGKATLTEQGSEQSLAITGGDIAVLVRSHKQASAIQHCLQQRGINSVQQGSESVFSSIEAATIARVLLAVAHANDEAKIKAALVTGLWGLNANELYQLQQDEKQWLKQLNFFYGLQQLWLKQGFMPMFSYLLVAKTDGITVQQRLLALPDGERQLTNLMHLAELIQDHCTEHGEGIETVLHWLAQQRQSSGINEDTAQIRLESDEQLVKIITIHKSKGLEYPIVFCPFLWDVHLRADKDHVISFHQEEQDNLASLAFAEQSLRQAAESATIEERAENLRILYVALTRARERCIIVWADVKNIAQSALFSLLHPHLEQADGEQMYGELTELAQVISGAISIEEIQSQQAIRYQEKNTTDHDLAAKIFTGTIHPPWRIGSFSALTRGHDAELPDHDHDAQSIINLPKNESLPILDRFSFPRGAQAGTCLHAIFELWDFASQDDEALAKLVSDTLLQYGFDEKWRDVVCQWINEVINTPLEGIKHSLFNLTVDQRLDELAFYFPVANLTAPRLQQILLPLLQENSALALTVQRANFYKLTGFMKGFIDLVFEDQGQFYVVDYKSNHLGNSGSDYQSKQLKKAMVAHDYPLQYLIYSVALHRYLKLRLVDYDPEKHLGGVYYLFIRGMKAEWQQAGIFYDKLDVAVLEAFDACLQQAGS